MRNPLVQRSKELCTEILQTLPLLVSFISTTSAPIFNPPALVLLACVLHLLGHLALQCCVTKGQWGLCVTHLGQALLLGLGLCGVALLQHRLVVACPHAPRVVCIKRRLVWQVRWR